MAQRTGGALGYQYPIYLSHLNFINPPGGYMDRRLPLGFWQTWWKAEANPRYPQLWAVKLVDAKSPVAQASRDDWSLCGYSQSAVRLDAPVPVKELSLRASALLPGQARPDELVARVALVRQGRVIVQWPLRQGREVNGQVIALQAPPEARPTRCSWPRAIPSPWWA